MASTRLHLRPPLNSTLSTLTCEPSAATLPATLMVQSALISAPLEKLMGPWAVKALPAGSIRAAWAW